MATYTTKLNAGQEAWFLKDNIVMHLPIGSVQISEMLDEEGKPFLNKVSYGIRIYPTVKDAKARTNVVWLEVPEFRAFATKAELLASL